MKSSTSPARPNAFLEKALGLSDEQLRQVMKADNILPAKFETSKGATKMGKLKWSEVCDILLTEPRKRSFVDVRDFPKDGELADYAAGLTQAFYALSLFPRMPTSYEDIRMTTLDRHPDLLQWVEDNPCRDAKSKICAATECHDPVQDPSTKTSQTQLSFSSALGSDLGTTPQLPHSRSTSSSSPTKRTSALGLV
ncbi:hypothetical protein A4X13_0g8679, partial [Tilletia indica]